MYSNSSIISGFTTRRNKFHQNIIYCPSVCKSIGLIALIFPLLLLVLPSQAQIIINRAGNGTNGYSGDGGAATSAQLNQTKAVAVDCSNNMYIADENNMVRMVNSSGIISTFAGNGSYGFYGDDGPATAANFNNIEAVTLDAAGNVYISDGVNHRIRKVNTSGMISTYAGNGSNSWTGDGGPATAASIGTPYKIACDATGNLYIADSYNDVVRKVNTSGVISTVAGNGTFGLSGNGGAATNAKIGAPWGVAVDNAGNIYIADHYFNNIRKVNTAGIISMYAGNGSYGYSGDGGQATAATMRSPEGVAVDAYGNVYIAEGGNHCIRKVGSTGIISTISGTGGTSGYSGDGGNATAALLNEPSSVGVDCIGNIYFTDFNNHVVREIIPNHPPTFNGGSSQFISVCAGSIANPTNTYLSVTDIDTAQTLTWSMVTAPLHGSALATYSIATNGGSVTPFGLYYTPTTGYVGNDSFKVQVIDGSSSAITVVHIAVNTTPLAITGTTLVCTGNNVTLANASSGGTWTSSNTTMATIGSTTGVVSGLSPGVVNITYALGSCYSLKTVTINPTPDAITGSSYVCTGTTTTMSETSSGGYWTSSFTSNATIGSVSGIVTGNLVGSTTISYNMSGCSATKSMSVITAPASITGTAVVCTGSTTTLADLTTGGTWISSNTSIVTVGSTGICTGVAAGNAIISYQTANCYAIKTVTVNATPSPISGPSTVCTGSTITLSNSTTGGTWSSTFTAYAGVGASTGIVNGVLAGVTTINYTISGCIASKSVSINTTPVAITGTASACEGASTTLNNTTTGGIWSIDNITVASIGSTSGIVTGIVAGTAIVTYTKGLCAVYKTVTINPSPASISGLSSVCTGSTITLTTSSTGGTWLSSFSSNATIGATTGIVTGMLAGVTNISYILAGCSSTKSVTVTTSPAAITGVSVVCTGATITLSNTTAGGTWSTANSSIADIGSTTGIVSGVTIGTTTITYSINGCNAYKTVSVNTSPNAGTISGTTTLCVGATTTLSSSVTGGIWATSNSAQATVSFGLVNGISAGNPVISYSLTNSCGTSSATTTLTINTIPGAGSITGTRVVCPGATTTLSNSVTGGTWTSSNTAVASIGSTGDVSGITGGTTIITYSVTSICGSNFTRTVVTVSPSPSPISGSTNICAGLTSTFTNSGGGIWSSSNSSIANINSTSGNVTGVATGLATITYTLATGCSISTGVIVLACASSPFIYTIAGNDTIGYSGDGGNAKFAKLSGPYGVAADCMGNTYIADHDNHVVRKVDINGIITTFAGTGAPGYSGDGGPASSAMLTNPISVAVDTVGNLYIADINSFVIRKVNTSGIISTVAGFGGVGYAGDGGAATAAMLFYPSGVCVDRNNNLYIADNANNVIRKVNNSGIISTVAGNDTVGYSGDGGPATMARLNAPRNVACDGLGNLYVTDYGNFAVRKISTSGIITTIAGTGFAGYGADGNPATSVAIDGPYGIACDGSNNVYISEQNNNDIRKINSSGIISTYAGNHSAGYSGDGGMATAAQIQQPMGLAFNCNGNLFISDHANYVVREIGWLNSAPYFVNGNTQNMNICVGSSAVSINSILAAIDVDSLQTITWSVNTAPTHGTLSATFSAIANGSILTPTGLTYTPTTGYTGADLFKVNLSDGTATTTVTINVNIGTTSIGGSIAGPSTACMGSNITLTNPNPGGSWISSDSSIATIGISNGIVGGINVGTAIITYTVVFNCGTGTDTRIITVAPSVSVSSILGNTRFCNGSSTTLTNASTGGSWSSSNIGIATVNSSGVVSGVSPGTLIISYALPSSCASALATKIVKVETTPSAGVIGGPTTVYTGLIMTLNETVPYGLWSSGNPSVATIGSNSGIVTGISTGTATITYVAYNTCGSATTTKVISVGGATCNTWEIITVAGNGAQSYSGDGGAATSAALNNPIGVGVDAYGNVYIADKDNHRIRKLTPAGIISTIAGTGTAGYSGDGGAASNAQLNGPNGVAVDLYGNIYIADEFNHRVRVIDNAGIIRTFSGTGTAGYGGDGGDAAIAQLNRPEGVGTDLNGNIYIVDFFNSVIRRVDINGIITTFAGTGVSSFGGDGGPATAAGLYHPTGVACDQYGNVIIDDENNVRIRKVDASGIITTIAGVGTDGYDGDGGPATDAHLMEPYGVCVDPLGNIYIGDRANSVVRRVDPSGIITTFAGTGVRGWYGDYGPATAAQLNLTYGLAIDGYGSIYVCDNINQRIRKVMINSLTPNTGFTQVCPGTNTTLSNATVGGTWSTSDIAYATVNATTGVVTGIAAGTATISYNNSTGCSATTIITINPLPASITGSSTVCTGATTTLSNTSTGGSWTSSNTAVATINSTSGIATGVSLGSAIITYTMPGGCINTFTLNGFTIAPISGASSLCASSTTNLTNATTGGTWISGNTSVATIGTSSGVVTGIGAGTALITYTFGGTCITASPISVISSPQPITGTTTICSGTNSTLNNSASGGTWSSSNTAVATINPATGAVSALTVGTTIISYTIPCGVATTVITVPQSPAAISGTTTLCQGSTTTLSNATAGGRWSSSNTSIATIGSSTGLLTAPGSGSATISYTLPSGCFATSNVNITSTAISGITTICLGATSVLTNATPGGLWTSSNSTVASVNCNLGIVKGLSVGTSIITYSFGSGCTGTIPVTIISLGANTGATSVCAGANTTLNNSTPGGVWTSSNTSVATVGSASGIVSGIANGNANIIYTMGSGCSSTTMMTVLSLGANTGSANVCQGLTTGLNNATVGGTWSSSNTGIATVVSGTGIVTGVNPGTAIITYNFGASCIATSPITVNTIPTSVTVSGGGTYCGSTTISATGGSGETIYFQGTTSGGTSTANPSTSQLITSSGTYYFRARSAAGCWGAEGSATVLIPTITGVTSICLGTSSTLSNTGGTGTWASSNTSVATIGASTGVVSGVAVGTSIITNTLSGGCVVTSVINVLSAPPAISGPSSVCLGQTMTLTNSGNGGTWSTSTPSIATVGLNTGIVTGIASGFGTANITYSLGASCVSTITISVNPISVVTGATTTCAGQTITLADATAGGSWISSNSSIASIGSTSGIVIGVASGTSTISYVMPTGCTATANISISVLSSITGPATVCVGQSITLADITSGGSWTSSAPTIATIGSASGVVTGVAGGLGATMTYTLGSGCKTTYIVSVNALSPIVSAASVCQGSTITLTDAAAGGSWSSSATTVGTIGGTTGVLTGVGGGITTISYIMPTGCTTTAQVFVNPVAPISGSPSVCIGQTVTLTNPAGAGTWASGTVTVATIGASTGIVSGLAAGLTSNITYTFCTGCKAFMTMSVYGLSPISGASSVCQGLSTTLTDATAGGTWSLSTPGIVSIGSTSGLVNGIAPGTAIVSYILPTGCTSTATMLVNPLTATTGPNTVCLGQTMTLSNATSGGIWTTSAPTIATVGAATGIVTGMAANLSANITYTLGSGCKSIQAVSVVALPTVAAITGASSVSISGSTITLTDATTGGVWTSSNPAKASVGAGTGVVTGVAVGTVTISYTVTNAGGCSTSATKVITVGPTTPTSGDTGTSTEPTNINLTQTGTPGNITILPNPNKGEFTIRGQFANNNDATDQTINIEVTNMLGQTVHQQTLTAINGTLDNKITLSKSLANGMYLLTINNGLEQFVFHVVIEQ